MNLLNASALNVMRGALYDSSASLTFYRMTPADGEVEVFTTRNGWHAQREAGESATSVRIWMSSEVTPITLDRNLHTGAKVVIDANGRAQAYRISSVRPMQQMGSGWVITCDPAENSTEPDNG
jgi:hypothetical protein